jgi:hypothetical protein
VTLSLVRYRLSGEAERRDFRSNDEILDSPISCRTDANLPCIRRYSSFCNTDYLFLLRAENNQQLLLPLCMTQLLKTSLQFYFPLCYLLVCLSESKSRGWCGIGSSKHRMATNSSTREAAHLRIPTRRSHIRKPTLSSHQTQLLQRPITRPRNFPRI